MNRLNKLNFLMVKMKVFNVKFTQFSQSVSNVVPPDTY